MKAFSTLTLICILGLSFLGTPAIAQTGTVTGTVTDSTTGDPLPGVNVSIQGTQLGSATNSQGSYTITSIEPGTYTVQASFLGYTTSVRENVTVEAGDATVVDFAMVESGIELEEVSVTALGVEREERSLSYAQQGLDNMQIEEAQEINVASSLAGSVAGISVNQAGTGVGGEARVILRGNRSITGNSEPLWVVDGVPVRDQASDINPADIAEINVLKGPNAAALYGSEAQNGAIVISTKKGQVGELSLSVNQNFQMRDPILLTDYQNVYGQGTDGQYLQGEEASWGPRMEGQTVNFWSPDPERADETYAFSPQPNNVADAYRRGYNSSTTIAATVGTQNIQSRVSYAYTKAEGVVPGNELARHNLTARVNSELAQDLSFDGKISYAREDINNQMWTGGSFANPNRHILRLPRNIRTADAENFEYFTSQGLRRQNFWNPGSNGGANPYWTMNRNLHFDTSERTTIMTSLTYGFTDALSLMVRGSYDGDNSINERKWYNDTYIIADNGEYFQLRSNGWEGNGEFLLSYADDVLPAVSVDANFGGNIRKERGGSLSSNTGQALTVPNFFTLSNTQNVEASESVGSPREVHSLYGFGQIGWRDAIYLDVTGRNDWSSTLPPENRSYFYPSVGVSAVVSELIPSFPDLISFAKLRASWAEVGNSAAPFQTIRTAAFSAGGNNGFLQLSDVLPAEDLKPEQTESYEVGLDVRLFQRLAGLNLTWYQTNTRNQLFTAALPVGSGASSFFTNGGDVQNKGIEATLSSRPVRSDNFSMNFEVNFSKNDSEVLRLTEDQPSLTIAQDFMREFRIVAGQPFGQIYSRGFARDDQGRVIVSPNGMPQITDGLSVQVADFNADWRGSFRAGFTYKNLNLSFMIDHRQGGSSVSFTNAILDADGLRTRTLQGRDGDLVFGENFYAHETAVKTDGSPNDLTVDAETFWRNVGGRNAPVGEAFVESATNTRLRELALGYTFPQSISAGLNVSSLRLSVVGRNLFFLHRKSSNMDPDLLTGTAAASEGFSSFPPPTARTLGVNLRVTY